jgi:Fe-S cluster assembly scaffold protein SufB
MKQGTYQQLSAKAYGELKSASIESQKALARGLKEELANTFPELNDLNAQDSKLLDLRPVLEKAIQRESNHQLGGISTPITAGAAKAVTGSNTAAAVAAVLKAVVDNPNIKSRIAIALSKQGVTLPAANARIQAYSSALAASAANNAAPDSQSGEPQQ